MTDEEVAKQSEFCRSIGVRIHIGDKIVFRDKKTQKTVGGLEIKKRLRQLELKK